MTKTRLLLSTIAWASLTLSANASTLENPWNFSILGSYLSPDSDRFNATDDDDFGVGLAFGHRFTPTWEDRVIAQGWHFNQTIDAYGLDALYHFNDNHLYGIAGLKHIDFNSDGNNILNLGLGKRFNMDSNLYFTSSPITTR